ncbi:unnamed protein product [Ambrosiozyma monospora]|uniref:ribonuclease H n=1 Tax=Ambrosiozyma monospora TaxID=43982 RepID=A0A9W7DDK4_AMBMO|nr:unnamed protein product [Ambrosiozyma monospora]
MTDKFLDELVANAPTVQIPIAVSNSDGIRITTTKESDFMLSVSGGRSTTCNPGLIHGLKMLTEQQSQLISSKTTTPNGGVVTITGFGTIVLMFVSTETQEHKCVSFPVWYAPDAMNFVGHDLFEHGISLKIGPKGQRIAWRSSINNHKIGLDLKNYGIPISCCVRPAKPETGKVEVTNPNFSTVEVFTDGACKNNNTTNPNIVRVAGCGVFFGDDDEKNVCESVTGSDYPGIRKVTNNLAELHAIKLALLAIMKHDLGRTRTKYRINCDSDYSVKCLTIWYEKWIKNNWKSNSKNPVEHKDLIMKCLEYIDVVNTVYKARGWGALEFVVLKGHSGIYGNEKADELANQAVVNARMRMV